MLAVVLAAGLGKRLYPLTDDRSKAMLPIAGEPMVARVMAQLAAEGVKRFVVVAHPEDEELLALLARRPWRGRVQVAFQDDRRGMADAVACAALQVREAAVDSFLLSSCDNLFPEGHIAALAAYQQAHQMDAVLTLMRVSREKVPTMAMVAMENERVTRIVEKPRPEDAPSDLGSAALYALTPVILTYLDGVPLSPRGEREFQDALAALIDGGGRVGGVMVEERQTLTTVDDLLALNRRFLRGDPSSAVVAANLPSDVVVEPPVRIEAGTKVGPGCQLGPEVYLEAGCRIGAEAAIRRAVVLRGAEIPPDARVQDTVLSHRTSNLGTSDLEHRT